MKKIIVCTAMLLIAGCAKPPEEIMATPVSADPYMQMDCQQLTTLKLQKETELAQIEKTQKNVSEHDKASMSVLHVPVASWTGQDRSEEVARSKGEAQAVTSAYQSKSCAAG